MSAGKAGTSALAHDEAMMCHIKNALALCLLLYRSTVALNTLPYLAYRQPSCNLLNLQSESHVSQSRQEARQC